MPNAYKILRALFDGGLDRRLRNEIRNWFFGDSGRSRKDDALRKLWEERVEHDTAADPEVSKRFAALCRRLGLPIHESDFPSMRVVRRPAKRLIYRFAGVAAVIMAIAAIGVTAYRYGAPRFETDRLAAGQAGLSEQAGQAGKGKRIERTEQSRSGDAPRMVTLPCGSKIWLRGESRLDIGRSQREVTLRGEACFTVEPNGKPFIVHAGQIDIRVLGTVFSVRNDGSAEGPTVDLFEGSVEVRTKKDKFTLDRGHRFAMDGGSGEWQIENLNCDTGFPDWVRTAMISADGIAFGDILRMISGEYGVEVVNNRPDLDPGRYLFTLTDDMRIEDAMNTLRLLNKNSFTYRIEGGILTIE